MIVISCPSVGRSSVSVRCFIRKIYGGTIVIHGVRKILIAYYAFDRPYRHIADRLQKS